VASEWNYNATGAGRGHRGPENGRHRAGRI